MFLKHNYGDTTQIFKFGATKSKKNIERYIAQNFESRLNVTLDQVESQLWFWLFHVYMISWTSLFCLKL